MKLLKLIVIFHCCLTPMVFSQTIRGIRIDSTVSSSVTSQNSVPDKEQNSISSKELELYKLLYDLAQKANNDLRQSFQWTYGLVVAFILLILGSQFLYNWRLNKQEINSLKSDLDLKFDLLKSQLSSEKENIFTELKSNADELHKKNKSSLVDRYLHYTEVLDATLEKNVKELQNSIHENEAEIALLKGLEPTALSLLIKVALYCVEEKPYLIIYKLEKINPLLSKATEIWQDDYDNLDKLIKNIKEKHGVRYSQQISIIEDNYKNKHKRNLNLSSYSSPLGDRFADPLEFPLKGLGRLGGIGIIPKWSIATGGLRSLRKNK